MLCLVCIPCIKGQTNHAGCMSIHSHLPMLYTVGGTPDTAAGSTSSSAGALVPPVQSSAQQSTPLTSGQQLSMHQAPPSQLGQQQSTHQAPPSHQGQQSQTPITSQPTGMLNNVKPIFVQFQNCFSQSQIWGEVYVCLWLGANDPLFGSQLCKSFYDTQKCFKLCY